MTDHLIDQGYKQDGKLQQCARVLQQLLNDGFHPIVWCHFVHTADYVKQGLEVLLKSRNNLLQILRVTGRLSDEERRAIIQDIDSGRPRVLVATDCLSEGINLQEKFNAVVHYDLPWNPNRLEQREGRVDRYGQTARKVRAILLYGQDNDVDGKLLEVLIRKSRTIRKAVGTHIPVPEESLGIAEVIARSVLLSRQKGQQQELFAPDAELETAEVRFTTEYDRSAQRLKQSRSRFAQHTIKPDEVEQELRACDQVLGDPETTRRFLLDAAQRLGFDLKPTDPPGIFQVAYPAGDWVPWILQDEISRLPSQRITFESPPPGAAVYVGRNHPLVSATARWILESSLEDPEHAVAARCGVIRTRAVSRLTVLLLLRARYLLSRGSDLPGLLAEEVLVTGFRGLDGAGPDAWLQPDEAQDLFDNTKPSSNIPLGEKTELVQDALQCIGNPDSSSPVWRPLEALLRERAGRLEHSHNHVGQAIEGRKPAWRLTPHLPPDVLSLLILQPEVKA